MDPTGIPAWTPEQLSDYLVRSLPPDLREACKARIISNKVTGREVLDMIRELGKPGSRPLSGHPTFVRIFDAEWKGEGWRKWGSHKMQVRNPEQAMHNFFMGLLNENASVVVAKAQQRIFQIIDARHRNFEFDAFYDPNDSWIIASGQQAIVQAEGGGKHMVGFYTAPCGWQRLALQVLDDGSKNFAGDEWLTWHKGYHGTRGVAVRSIVTNGLMQPGAVVGGFKVESKHGAVGAKGDRKPIYVSPCLGYSAHHIYTAGRDDTMKKFEALDVAGDAPAAAAAAAEPSPDKGASSGLSFADVVAAESTYAQFVFEVRVKPGSYRVQGNTVEPWPKKGAYKGPHPKTEFMEYDDCCMSDLVEWLVEDARDVVCTGVMIRQLPHSLKEQSMAREAHMRALTDFDDAEGARRPRNWGVGCENGAPPSGVAWEYNDEPSDGATLSYGAELRWRRYAPEISEIVENAYLAYQRFVFIGQPPGAPGPYCIHFGRQWHRDCASHEPEQRRADGDKKQDWRRRSIRRVAV